MTLRQFFLQAIQNVHSHCCFCRTCIYDLPLSVLLLYTSFDIRGKLDCPAIFKNRVYVKNYMNKWK